MNRTSTEMATSTLKKPARLWRGIVPHMAIILMAIILGTWVIAIVSATISVTGGRR